MANAAPKRLHVIDGLTFRGDYDSGRLGSVRKGIDGVYEILIPADCEELHLVSEYRIWYFFSIVGGYPGERITCRIMNLHQVGVRDRSADREARPDAARLGCSRRSPRCTTTTCVL